MSGIVSESYHDWRFKNVTLCWFPEHIRISRNECVNILAKEDSATKFIGIEGNLWCIQEAGYAYYQELGSKKLDR